MRRIALLTATLWFVVASTATAAPVVVAGGQLRAPATGIVAGLDGSLWHTSQSAIPAVGRTTVSGRTLEMALADRNAEPGAIVRGPDYALWVADESGAILRVSANGLVETVREIDGSPQSLALGPDGNVWFTQTGKDDAIGRLTPDGELALFTQGLTGSPSDIAAGPDGALWFTEPGRDRVGRIAVDGNITEFEAGDLPTSIALGLDGAMWFTLRKAIGRVATDGTVTSFSEGLPNSSWQPEDIALGIDGAMWFTTKRGIGRITSTGAITTYPTPGLRPGAIAVGGDGAMWFTDQVLPVLGRIGSLPSLALATPVLGKTVFATVERGEVAVRTPGGKSFKPLAPVATALPVGTIVDASDGAIELRSALARAGKTQTGTFFGGRFQVRQPRKRKGLVRIALRGRLECRADSSLATTSRRRKRRRIWGVDLGGLFQTLGLDSITTVRGTRWLTEDRCNGTLTRVTRGSVIVRERATGKRVVVRAGERYLARRR